MATETIVATKQNSEAKAFGEFGKGRYSRVMGELYKDLQRYCNLSPAAAHKLSEAFGSDFGRAMANAEVSARIGRVTKDGTLNLAEAVKGVKATATYSLSAAKLCFMAAEMAKAGAKEISFDLPKEVHEFAVSV